MTKEQIKTGLDTAKKILSDPQEQAKVMLHAAKRLKCQWCKTGPDKEGVFYYSLLGPSNVAIYDSIYQSNVNPVLIEIGSDEDKEADAIYIKQTIEECGAFEICTTHMAVNCFGRLESMRRIEELLTEAEAETYTQWLDVFCKDEDTPGYSPAMGYCWHVDTEYRAIAFYLTTCTEL